MLKTRSRLSRGKGKRKGTEPEDLDEGGKARSRGRPTASAQEGGPWRCPGCGHRPWLTPSSLRRHIHDHKHRNCLKKVVTDSEASLGGKVTENEEISTADIDAMEINLSAVYHGNLEGLTRLIASLRAKKGKISAKKL